VKHLYRFIISSTILLLANQFLFSQSNNTLTISQLTIGGELEQRIISNTERLEKIDYSTNKLGTINEKKGVTIANFGLLIQALSAQADIQKKAPNLLKSYWVNYADLANELGYFGDILPDNQVNESQLAANGLMLSALSQNFKHTNDSLAIERANAIIDNLVMPTQTHYTSYWAEKNLEKNDSLAQQPKHWQFSANNGDIFILLDGLINIYTVNKRAVLLPIINQLISAFNDKRTNDSTVSLLATLHGIKACTQYASLTDNKPLLLKISKAYSNIIDSLSTTNHEIFIKNESATNSALTALTFCCAYELWNATKQIKYLEDAQLIYYNALAFEQRYNGGFGNQSITQPKDLFLQVNQFESVYEGNLYGMLALGYLAKNIITTSNQKIFLTTYQTADYIYSFKKQHISLSVETQYPFSNLINIGILQASALPISVSFPEFSFLKINVITLNGKKIPFIKKDGFANISTRLKKGDKLTIELDRKFWQQKVNNNTAYYHGPLLLSKNTNEATDSLQIKTITLTQEGKYQTDTNITLAPVYHLLDTAITDKPQYNTQILFK
jgi:hypothetical protein